MSTPAQVQASKDTPKAQAAPAPPQERIEHPKSWHGCLACGQTSDGIRVKMELTTCGKIACWSFPVGTIITCFTCKSEVGRCAKCDAILFNKEKKGQFDCC